MKRFSAWVAGKVNLFLISLTWFGWRGPFVYLRYELGEWWNHE